MRSRGRMLEWSPNHRKPNGLLGPWLVSWSVASSPSMAGGPPSPCAIKRGGGRRLKVRGSLSRTPHRQTLAPIQRGCAVSDGKHLHCHCITPPRSPLHPHCFPDRRCPSADHRLRGMATGSSSNSAPAVSSDGLHHVSPTLPISLG
jgi:hypothetical protein